MRCEGASARRQAIARRMDKKAANMDQSIDKPRLQQIDADDDAFSRSWERSRACPRITSGMPAIWAVASWYFI